MYLKQTPQKNGRVKLAVYEGYREGERTRSRNVRPLGYLDELAAAKDAVVSAMNRRIAKSGARDLSAVFCDVTNYYFEADGEDGLRMKGVSKEHRKSPIVQMGLLQDANGIPIAYRKFPGNTADCLTMSPCSPT